MIQLIDLYKQIVEGLTNSVLLLNSNLELEYINPAGEMLFDVSNRRLKGMNIEELFAGNQHLNNEMKQALESNNPFTQRELELTLLNKKVLKIDCVVTPLIDVKDTTDKNTKRMMLIELYNLDRGMRMTREEHNSAQSNAMRSLVRGLAHEIKNPLGGLRGAAQLLERELEDESLKEFTNIIIGEADRLRNLVNSLLGPTKLPQQELLNIHEITEHVTQLISVDIAQGIKIVHDYDPSIPDLYADRDQLIQALLNIAVNAVHAVDDDHGVITLRTRTLRQQTIGQVKHKLAVQVDIADNGIGIPEDMLETIFFPMVTNRAEGSGLGLSISQTLIQRHNGLIQCTSEPGNTVFSIMLPIEKQ